jgi:hypothetical protein
VTKVIIHPAVRLRDLSDLIRDNPVILKYVVRPGVVPDRTAQVLCVCKVCGWYGPDPLMVDTADTFNPPRGDIPRCRQCGSFQLGFRFEGAA